MLYVLQTCSVGWHSEEPVTTNIHVVNACTLCMGSFYLPYMWFYDVWKYFTYISPRSITGWLWTVVMNSFVYSCENINLLDWLNAVLFKQRLAPWVFSLSKPVAISDPHRWDALRRLWITFIILFMYTIHSTHQFTIVALRIFGRFWHQNSKWFIAGWL